MFEATAELYALTVEFAAEFCRLAFEYARDIWSVAKAIAHPDDSFPR